MLIYISDEEIEERKHTVIYDNNGMKITIDNVIYVVVRAENQGYYCRKEN
jgi:hypothetical protein